MNTGESLMVWDCPFRRSFNRNIFQFGNTTRFWVANEKNIRVIMKNLTNVMLNQVFPWFKKFDDKFQVLKDMMASKNFSFSKKYRTLSEVSIVFGAYFAAEMGEKEYAINTLEKVLHDDLFKFHAHKEKLRINVRKYLGRIKR